MESVLDEPEGVFPAKPQVGFQQLLPVLGRQLAEAVKVVFRAVHLAGGHIQPQGRVGLKAGLPGCLQHKFKGFPVTGNGGGNGAAILQKVPVLGPDIPFQLPPDGHQRLQLVGKLLKAA